MAKTIAVCNQKGGVGKTTTAVNLGIGLARMNYKVLMIDADPQADMTTCLGCQDKDELPNTFARLMREYTNDNEVEVREAIIHHDEGVDFIASNIELSSMEMQLVTAMGREQVMRNLLSKVKDDYDYIVIDCMPSLGMITINSLTAADSVIIPVQAQYLSAMGMMQLVQTITRVKKHMNPELNIDGLLITLSNSRDNLSKDVAKTIKDGYGELLNVYDTIIPSGVAAAYASTTGKSVYSFDSHSNVAQAYMQFVREFTLKDVYTIENVPINTIKNRGFGMYTTHNYSRLAASIEKNGLREPIEAYRTPSGEIELIDGWRRLKACEILGWENIDVKLYNVTPERADRLKSIKNFTYTNEDDETNKTQDKERGREMI